MNLTIARRKKKEKMKIGGRCFRCSTRRRLEFHKIKDGFNILLCNKCSNKYRHSIV